MPDIKVEQISPEEFNSLKSAKLPRGYLSASQIQKYLTCPEDYRLTYIEGRSFKPNSKMLRGSSVHKMVEKSLIMLKGRGVAPSEEEILDSSRSIVETVVDSREASEELDIEEIIDSSQKSFKAWYKERMHCILPIAVECEVLALVGEVPVKGFVDYVDGYSGSPQIVDLKVGNKKRDPCNSLQLGLYSLTMGINSVAYDTILQPTKRLPCRINFESAEYTEKYVQHIGRIIQRVYEGITSGYFPLCLPDNWACSPKFCSNFERCRGNG